MAGLVERAPAREVLPGEVMADAGLGDEYHATPTIERVATVIHHVAEYGNRLCPVTVEHVERIAPDRRSPDVDRVRRHPSALGALSLNPDRCHAVSSGGGAW